MKRVVGRELLTTILREAAPADLRIVGRTLLHAAIVGVAAGLMGAAFFARSRWCSGWCSRTWAATARCARTARRSCPSSANLGHFRPWLLVLLPAVGALASGIVSQLAPETRGGGGDAMIDAFHRQDGVIRKRVAWVKALASIFTLGTGGSGGREGPTMQIGGALGSLVRRGCCGVDAAERRILMVAGVAAGIAAVFRTPLGAALLAVEVLYRDDFESDALIPAVLASVIAYSVVISIFGESTLFAHPGHFPFVIKHLPLYGAAGAAGVGAGGAVPVVAARRAARDRARSRSRAGRDPGLGGLALGVFCVPIILFVGWQPGASPARGWACSAAATAPCRSRSAASDWLPVGWAGVGAAAVPLPGQDHRVVADHRHGRQRGRLRARRW